MIARVVETVIIEDMYPDNFKRKLQEKLNEQVPENTTQWEVYGYTGCKGYSALLLRYEEV